MREEWVIKHFERMPEMVAAWRSSDGIMIARGPVVLILEELQDPLSLSKQTRLRYVEVSYENLGSIVNDFNVGEVVMGRGTSEDFTFAGFINGMHFRKIYEKNMVWNA